MIPAGDKNDRIAFECRGKATGPDSGNSEGEFAEQFTLWARMIFLRGSESVIASRLQGRQPVIFTVEANSLTRQITNEWQARDKRTGIAYAILGVSPSEDRADFDILGESGRAS
ncbi:head-tail adaptor protein [Mesorhizobium sp. IMUNJ 23232]|uniref:head-tail adaptor protein n=1 Tax=Mesorhizobium sp. IMUNJ 23232 TaxID=3376064 RepID=UPI00378BD4BE